MLEMNISLSDTLTPYQIFEKQIIDLYSTNGSIGVIGAFAGVVQFGDRPFRLSGYRDLTTLEMMGSPYGSYFSEMSSGERLIQHACPNLEIFEDIHINSRAFVLGGAKGTYATRQLPSVNRNGYISNSGSRPSFRLTMFIYWDNKREMAMILNPFSKTTPTPWIP